MIACDYCCSLACGKPKEIATLNSTGFWTREFPNCTVALNQHSNHYEISQAGVVVASG